VDQLVAESYALKEAITEMGRIEASRVKATEGIRKETRAVVHDRHGRPCDPFIRWRVPWDH
jgi:hypothetical protein